MADIYGQLIKAQLEASTSDLSSVAGLVYYKSDTGVVKYYDAIGTAWRTVATTDTAITDVTTTRGDLIRRGASALERFAAVTDNRVVRGDGTDVISGQIDDPDFFTTGAAAGASAIGIVTTSAQTFAGAKTFADGVIFDNATIGGFSQSAMTAYVETGTWTPTITAGSGTPTMSSQVGRFTRIGNVVFVWGRIAWQANGASGNLSLGGLPFTSANISSSGSSGAIHIVDYAGTTLASTSTAPGHVITTVVNTNATTSLFIVQGGSGEDTAMTVAMWEADAAAKSIAFTGFYFTA
jgi:hypothetical protein